jgi:hypothetical protein
MPTHDALEPFLDDFSRLSLADKNAFRDARRKFAEDVDSGDFRAPLRVKPMKGNPGIWEMT